MSVLKSHLSCLISTLKPKDKRALNLAATGFTLKLSWCLAAWEGGGNSSKAQGRCCRCSAELLPKSHFSPAALTGMVSVTYNLSHACVPYTTHCSLPQDCATSLT